MAGARGIARGRIEQTADASPHIVLKLGFSNSWSLEVEVEEDGNFRLRHHRSWRSRTSRLERNAQANDGIKPVGPEQRCVPRDGPAPVVASDNSRLHAKG